MKTIIMLALLMAATVNAEEIQKDFELESVLVTFFWFDSEAELQEFFDGEERLKAYSECEIYEDKNLAHCDLYVVRPQNVDDDFTTSIGHEVLHGAYGPEYHEEVE